LKKTGVKAPDGSADRAGAANVSDRQLKKERGSKGGLKKNDYPRVKEKDRRPNSKRESESWKKKTPAFAFLQKTARGPYAD